MGSGISKGCCCLAPKPRSSLDSSVELPTATEATAAAGHGAFQAQEQSAAATSDSTPPLRTSTSNRNDSSLKEPEVVEPKLSGRQMPDAGTMVVALLALLASSSTSAGQFTQGTRAAQDPSEEEVTPDRATAPPRDATPVTEQGATPVKGLGPQSGVPPCNLAQERFLSPMPSPSRSSVVVMPPDEAAAEEAPPAAAGVVMPPDEAAAEEALPAAAGVVMPPDQGAAEEAPPAAAGVVMHPDLPEEIRPFWELLHRPELQRVLDRRNVDKVIKQIDNQSLEAMCDMPCLEVHAKGVYGGGHQQDAQRAAVALALVYCKRLTPTQAAEWKAVLAVPAADGTRGSGFITANTRVFTRWDKPFVPEGFKGKLYKLEDLHDSIMKGIIVTSKAQYKYAKAAAVTITGRLLDVLDSAPENPDIFKAQFLALLA